MAGGRPGPPDYRTRCIFAITNSCLILLKWEDTGGGEESEDPSVDERGHPHAQHARTRKDKDDSDGAETEAERGSYVSESSSTWCDAGRRSKEKGGVKGQVVPQDESSSESCLHCEINDRFGGEDRRKPRRAYSPRSG